MQKVGYDGTLMFEIARARLDEGDAAPEGARSAAADAEHVNGCCARLLRRVRPHMHVYIEDIGKHEGEEVTIKGGCTTAARAARFTS